MANNPFTYGNPISDPRRFFGREPEIELIFSRLRNAEFESSSLVGERRIGKTSLLNYLADRDVRRRHDLLPGTHMFVYVDLQIMNQDVTPVRLWQRLLRQMGRVCQDTIVHQAIDEIRQQDTIDNFALADLFDIIDEKNQYVVFLLDEFEKVTENPNFGTDFFYGLRSLAIQHHLALVTSSRRELIELCHSEAIRSSPFFNIFSNINVGLFTEDEARELIDTSLAGTDVGFSENITQMIFRVAGFHPYFLQAACYHAFESYRRPMSEIERAQMIAGNLYQEAAPHVANYWHTSDEHEKIVLTVLSLLERRGRAGDQRFDLSNLREYYTRSEQTLSRLEKRGLIMEREDGFGLFNAAFGDWITEEITDVAHDPQGYDDWLRTNRSVFDKLSNTAKSEMGQILPKISGKYRDLILGWVGDPKNLLTAAALLRGVLAR
ncbi:MAG TPA: AAA-like domain-containing protein [Anaerolineae bacterium]|nr:AAA-like domain-containing protein [Anaerolineae bacterium]